jgi:hypothetical protein
MPILAIVVSVVAAVVLLSIRKTVRFQELLLMKLKLVEVLKVVDIILLVVKVDISQ